MKFVIDSSALVAILQREPEAERFEEIISTGDDPVISAGTLAEASMVMWGKTGEAGCDDLDELLARGAVRVIAVEQVQAYIAREAYRRWGRGSGSGSLNFGDCFSYALARMMGRKLLFKGDDFLATNIEPALVS